MDKLVKVLDSAPVLMPFSISVLKLIIEFFKFFPDKRNGNRLQQIALHTIPQGFSGKFKILIAAKKDDFCINIIFSHILRHIDSTDMNHFNIHEQNIGAVFLEVLDNLASIGHNRIQFIAEALPINMAEPISHHELIIGND